MAKWTSKRDIPEDAIVTLAGNAAIAGEVGDGRLIPVLILDASARPEIAELLRVHEHVNPGDVRSQWSVPLGHPGLVTLTLEFSRPMELFLPIRFDVDNEHAVVDLILTAKAAYLQAGVPGDGLANTMDDDRLLIELPETGFEEMWEEIFLSRMTKHYRQEGLSRRAATEMAKRAIADSRRLSQLRMPQ